MDKTVNKNKRLKYTLLTLVILGLIGTCIRSEYKRIDYRIRRAYQVDNLYHVWGKVVEKFNKKEIEKLPKHSEFKEMFDPKGGYLWTDEIIYHYDENESISNLIQTPQKILTFDDITLYSDGETIDERKKKK